MNAFSVLLDAGLALFAVAAVTYLAAGTRLAVLRRTQGRAQGRANR